MEEIQLDYNRPVLDITYQNVSTINLEYPAEVVRAAVLTGNPIDDFQFLVFLKNLQLVHGDSMGLTSFIDLRVDRLEKLTHLVLRLNALTSFKHLRSCPTLQQLDVSQNPLELHSEESFCAQFKNLRRIAFGCVSSVPVQTSYCSSSRAKVNSLELFLRAFVYPYYQPENVQFGSPDVTTVNTVQFNALSEGNKMYLEVRKTDDGAVTNFPVVLSCYTIITGYEIVKTHTSETWLKEIANGVDFSIREHFSPQPVLYPTQQTNTNPQDLRVFDLLYTRTQDQIVLRENFNILTVEMAGSCSVFMSSRKGQELVQFQEAAEKIQSQIASADGLKLRIGRTGNEQQLLQAMDAYKAEMLSRPDQGVKEGACAQQLVIARELLRLQDPAPVQFKVCKMQDHQDIMGVDYYVTELVREELAKLFAFNIYNTTGEKTTLQKCLDVVADTMRDFTKAGRQIFTEGDAFFVYLTVKYGSALVPVKIRLVQRKQTKDNVGVVLNAFSQQKYVFADVKFKDGMRMSVCSEYPVRYIPQKCRAELTHQRPVLLVDVREEVNGKLKLCNYKFFTYIFLKNGEKCKETTEPYLDMQKERILPDGYFKCIVAAKDDHGAFTGDEFETNGLYLRLNDEYGQDYQDGPEFGEKGDVDPKLLAPYKELIQIGDNPIPVAADNQIQNNTLATERLSLKRSTHKMSGLRQSKKPELSGLANDEEKARQRLALSKPPVETQGPSKTAVGRGPGNTIQNTAAAPGPNTFDLASSMLNSQQQSKYTPQKSQAIVWNVLANSHRIGQPIEVEFRCLCSRKAPVCLPIAKIRTAASPGFLPSQADVRVKQNGSIWVATITPHRLDVGKMFYLYVWFEPQVYQLIPVTYQSILGPLEDNLLAECVAVDIGEQKIQSVRLKGAGRGIQQQYADCTSFIMEGAELDVLGLDECVLCPEQFLRKLQQQQLTLEQLHYALWNSLLRVNFLNWFSFQPAGPLLDSEAEGWLEAFDQNKLVAPQSAPNRFAVLSYRGYCQLYFFEAEELRDAFVVQAQNQLGLLYEESFEDPIARRVIGVRQDLTQEEFPVQQYLSAREKTSISCAQTLNCQAPLRYEVQLQPDLEHLGDAFSYAVLCGKNELVLGCIKSAGRLVQAQAELWTAGCKVQVIHGQFSRLMTQSGSASSSANDFLRFPTKDYEKRAFQMVDNYSLKKQLEVFTQGAFYPAEISISRAGDVVLTGQNKSKVTAGQTETRVIARGRFVVLAGRLERILLKCVSETDAAETAFYFGFQAGQHFYQ